jgi:hypothetical protein
MFATAWRRGFVHILPRPPPIYKAEKTAGIHLGTQGLPGGGCDLSVT